MTNAIVKKHNKVLTLLEQATKLVKEMQELGTDADFHPMQDPQAELSESIVLLMESAYLTHDDLAEAKEQLIIEGKLQ